MEPSIGSPRPGAPRTRLISLIGAGITLAAFVPTGLMVIAAGISMMRYLGAEVDATARSLNQAVAQETRRILGVSEMHLDFLAELASREADPRLLSTAMTLTARSQPEINRVLALDEKGILVSSSPQEPGSVIQDFSGLFFEPRAGSSTGFSRAFLSPIDGRVSVYIARKAAGSGPIRKIVLEMNLENLSSFLVPLRIFGDDMIAILDDAGRYIAHTDIGNVWEQRYETSVELARTGKARFHRYDVDWLAWSLDIPDTPWRVAYYRNAGDAFSVFGRLLRLAALVLPCCLAASAAMIVGMDRSIVRVIGQYSRSAESIAAGRYGQSLPAPYREFAGLSASIESMARAVSGRESALRAAVQEREQLLREIHHRVKNNLQIVISLLSLERHTLTDPGQAEAFESSIERIRSMALIHEILYGQDNLDRVDIEAYASNLLNQLLAAYANGDVRLNQTVQPIRLPLDTAIPLGLILNELVTNALKYGMEGGDTPSLDVRFGLSGTAYELSVEDRGPGMKPGAASESALGLVLVRSLAAQLNGAFDLSPGASGRGTLASVRFPKAPG